MSLLTGRSLFRVAGALFLAGVTSGCNAVAPPLRAEPLPALNRVEARYVERTATTIYRSGTVERLRGFAFADDRGFGTCIRAPAGAAERADYTLLVLQRRILEDYVSQVGDDVLVLRSRADAASCRSLAGDPGAWTRVR